MERKILDTNLKLLLGQEMAKELVSKSLEAGGCSTYLLVGPPQVGKGLLARIMAASWHNTTEIGKPHLDTVIFDEILATNAGEKEENKWKKTVDDIVHLVHLSPSGSQYRVLIIDDIDRLSISAANALLKTLEEPPLHARIIITARDINAVLPTVRSRAQIIRLNSLADEEIRDYLKKQKVKKLNEATLLANGAVGAASGLAKDPKLLEQAIDQLEAFKTILAKDAIKGMAIANIKDREIAATVVAVWTNLTRRLLLSDLRDERAQWLGESVTLPDEQKLAVFLSRLREASDALSAGANVRVVMEALVLAGVQGL